MTESGVFNPADLGHYTLQRLCSDLASVNVAVHGRSLVTCVPDPQMFRQLMALLTDTEAVMPLLDELGKKLSTGYRGFTAATPGNFPPLMRGLLTSAVRMVKHYDAKPGLGLRPFAFAVLDNGTVLTVNEPHGKDIINEFDGV